MNRLRSAKILVAMMAVILASCFVSCMEKEDFGYPSKINFPAGGDTLSFTGNKLKPGEDVISGIELLDYDGNGGKPSFNSDGDLTVTTDWLTVTLSLDDNTMQLVAEPNLTKKKRKLYLYIHSGRGWQEITVQQAK